MFPINLRFARSFPKNWVTKFSIKVRFWGVVEGILLIVVRTSSKKSKGLTVLETIVVNLEN